MSASSTRKRDAAIATELGFLSDVRAKRATGSRRFSVQLVVLGPLTCKREHTFAPRRPYCTENRRPRSPAQLSSTALGVSGPKHVGWPES